eukprot:TRINITY_DN1755_c0_g1_i12.p1 TRINITY_DN1755_c0_g1~~TRINITY_DN1755_c0_g1_i12.p1  ORF type:complete len:265 (-),score=29.19 TRINITY_DN1755_c0_g1_i12:79-873(-)
MLRGFNWKRITECLTNNSGDGDSYKVKDDTTKADWTGLFGTRSLTLGRFNDNKPEDVIHINLDDDFTFQGESPATESWNTKGVRYSSGTIGKGDFDQYGSLEGFGEMLDSDGIRYIGEFEDSICLKGSWFLPDGTILHGDFHGNIFDGTITWKDGFQYSGKVNQGPSWRTKLILITSTHINHPKVEACISSNECTAVHNMPLPQKCFRCSKCDARLCESCKGHGHSCSGILRDVYNESFALNMKCQCAEEECKRNKRQQRLDET